ncbi:MAG: tripartite tricarboxylate transporter substrate binding protein [Treponema sp.]|nr:tripartite tricarboxylate transporter substrate binding protein [Treponema sp.]
MKKRVLVFSMLLFFGLALALHAGGQGDGTWPTRPITIVVPATPGGDTDFNARAYATRLQRFLGQPVVVQNMVGAGMALGSRHVRAAAPDGYTILIHHISMFVNYATGANDFGVEAFEVAAIIGREGGSVVTVNAASPYTTLEQLMRSSQTASPPLSFAGSAGASTFVMGTMLNREGGGFNLVDIGNAADRSAALMGGHITAIPNAVGTLLPFLQSGDFRALAILSNERNPFAPDIPTAVEQGFNVTMPIYYFFAFPMGTPPEIVERFTDALEQVNRMPEYASAIQAFMQVPVFVRGEAARQQLLAQQDEILAMTDMILGR